MESSGGFDVPFGYLSYNIYEQDHQLQEPLLKKLKTTGTNAKELGPFVFEFHVSSKMKIRVQYPNGENITRVQLATLRITSFVADPRNFKYWSELQQEVSDMLAQVGMNYRVGATEKAYLTQLISSKACEIVNSASIMGRPMLPMVFELNRDFVKVQYGSLEQYLTEQAMRASEIEASERLNMVPASRKAINELEKFEYDGGDSIINKECTICFDEFEMGLEVTRLPCSHGFHRNCITTWLENSHLCPLCRFKMPVSSDSV